MEDFSKEDRGIFQGIKVPFCLNAIILAFMAYVIFVAGSHVLGVAMQDKTAYQKVVLELRNKAVRTLPIMAAPMDEILLPMSLAREENISKAYKDYYKQQIDDPKVDRDTILSEGQFRTPSWWQYIVFGVWFLLIWSFFAGAINRTAAYRIARDESITLREGLNFGAQTWANHFLAILFIAIFLAASFFMCVLATFILGFIPYAGELVLIFVFLLIFVAAFLITLLLAGLLFGFNMISSAIGVDKVDSFDAISRSYSYVLGRPWQTLLYTFLPLLFIIVFLYFGEVFQDVARKAVAWGFGSEAYAPMGKYFQSNKSWTSIVQELGIEPAPRVTMQIAAAVIKVFLWLAQLFIYATAIAYWLSARTKAYLLLRKEVDGDEVEEMFLDEEEEALEVPPSPAAPPKEEAEEKAEETKPAEKKEGKKHTKAELEKLTMDELRAIGKELDVTGRSKNKIIERILDAQK